MNEIKFLLLFDAENHEIYAEKRRFHFHFVSIDRTVLCRQLTTMRNFI